MIINCAAKTQVDKAENTDYYWEFIEVNGYGIQYLAERFQGDIIHISSDYIWKGKYRPYSEDYVEKDDDVPTRKMGYGISKFMGDLFARQKPNVYIVRTTGLYGGPSGRHDFLNFVLTNPDDKIPVTKDLRGNQTFIPHQSEAVLKYVEIGDRPKIIHLASREVISRYEFALMIAGRRRNRELPAT